MGRFPSQPGGLNRYVRELVGALEALGAETTTVVVGPASDSDPTVTVARSGQTLPGRLVEFARAVRRQVDAQIIDIHFGLYAVVPTRLSPLRRLPCVLHFHGPWDLEGVASGDNAITAWAKYLVERLAYRRADEAVVLSRAFRRLLVERYRFSPWRVNVIPPGVDLERFSPGDRSGARAQLGLPEDAWIALALRRLVPRMGVDVLVSAWDRLAPDDGLLLIGGDGSAREVLERHASDTVRFLGRVDDELLPTYYRAADVCVIPSRSLEGFGLVALEALACGTPVIATDVGGLPEALDGLGHDLVVTADDVHALAERLSAARSGRRPLPSGERARAHAEQFTWARAAEHHAELYRRLAEGAPRRRMRVVYLDHTAVLSGGELALARLLPALVDVDVHVILGEEGPLVKKLEEEGVSVEVLPLAAATRSRNRRAVGLVSVVGVDTAVSALYALRLAARLRRLEPDVVHTNSLKAALYGGVAGRLARVPVVWHVRDRIAADYLGNRATAIVRAAARTLPTVVIANSHSTLATVGVDGWVIPSPIEPSSAAPPKTGATFTVGMVGRIARWKGQHVFIEAFARAFPDGPERATIVGAPMFGEDDRAYDCEVRALVDELGLGERVRFTGFVDDVSSWLAEFDVLVNASVAPEPFGQVVVQGMATGLPVVATDAGGPAEMIDDGVSGFTFPIGDASALAEILVRIARDPQLRADVGSRGRSVAVRFKPDVVAQEVRRVYRAALSESRDGLEKKAPRSSTAR
jgi:glycosyltransferase involved in cell wall biosynthesis